LRDPPPAASASFVPMDLLPSLPSREEVNHPSGEIRNRSRCSRVLAHAYRTTSCWIS
jgi:hypothetical protein